MPCLMPHTVLRHNMHMSHMRVHRVCMPHAMPYIACHMRCSALPCTCPAMLFVRDVHRVCDAADSLSLTVAVRAAESFAAAGYTDARLYDRLAQVRHVAVVRACA